MEKEDKLKELINKFGVTEEKIAELEKEQKKLSKLVSIKDSVDFNLAEVYAGMENVFKGNRIISVIVLMKDNEVIEQKYILEKVDFPYISGLRAYRELPSMIKVFNMLEEKPDVVFIRSSGILHKHGFGLSSHFSLLTNVPTISISDSEGIGKIRKQGVFVNDKQIGCILKLKEEANPIYVSPANLISLKSSEKLTKRLTTPPHKLPDVLIEAKKYAKQLLREIFPN
jgi:deoxyribonuclease V